MNNLYLAYSKARIGKGSTSGVKNFEMSLDENIYRLSEELVSGTYVISAYETFFIYEPKERLIFRLPFRDRVIQHAIVNVLGPIWSSIFISHTYACIKGRGIHAVVRQLKNDLKNIEETAFCLKIDIRKFYPSIDHDILKSIVRKKIKDFRLLKLLDNIIDSAPGIPIGNYLSQFFANLYLSYMDHWLKEVKKVRYYYRYADDIVILSGEKQYLHDLSQDINDYLRTNLKLELKKNYQVFPVDKRGIDFVGYVFRHTHILMRKAIKKNLCRKAAKLNKLNISNAEYKRRLSPNLGWAKHCNSRNLIKTVVKNEEVLRLWD